MLKIRTGAMTMNTRGIGLVYANVMKQSSSLDKISVEVELRMCIDYPECLVSHVTAMPDKQPSQLVVLGIVLIDDI